MQLLSDAITKDVCFSLSKTRTAPAPCLMLPRRLLRRLPRHPPAHFTARRKQSLGKGQRFLFSGEQTFSIKRSRNFRFHSVASSDICDDAFLPDPDLCPARAQETHAWATFSASRPMVSPLRSPRSRCRPSVRTSVILD